MGHVNNVILTFSIMEEPKDRIREINALLSSEYDEFVSSSGQGFPEDELPGTVYGGSKVLEHNVHIAAFNFVSKEHVIDAVKQAKWEEPENVRVFWCGQHEDAFSLALSWDSE